MALSNFLKSLSISSQLLSILKSCVEAAENGEFLVTHAIPKGLYDELKPALVSEGFRLVSTKRNETTHYEITISWDKRTTGDAD